MSTYTVDELRAQNVTLDEAIAVMEAHHLDPEFIDVDAMGRLIYWATTWEDTLPTTVAYPAKERGKFPGSQVLAYLGYE